MELKNLFDEKIVKLTNQWERFPWQDRLVYAVLCRQIYSWAQESSPLLAIAGARVQNLDLPIKLKTKLKSRFFNHTLEEIGHEFDAEKDLKFLGYELNSFPVLSSTKAMWASQYYLIEHLSPISFFGYILTLEGIAVKKCSWAHNQVVRAHGAGGKFLNLHGDEDEDHLEKAFNTLSELDPKCLDIVSDSMSFSIDCFHRVFEETIAYAQEIRRKDEFIHQDVA
ncbi:MAG: hypothetical protein AB8E15_00210 [Bdellovibrionales bacterium]